MTHRKQHKLQVFVYVLVVSEQVTRIHCFKYHFERNFVYISIFKSGPKHAPIVVDLFLIFSKQVFKSLAAPWLQNSKKSNSKHS